MRNMYTYKSNMAVCIGVVASIILLSGCVGYQSITEYDFTENGDPLPTYKMRALIYGTSGQQVKTNTISLEKNDAVDQFVDVIQTGIGAGLEAAKGSDIL